MSILSPDLDPSRLFGTRARTKLSPPRGAGSRTGSAEWSDGRVIAKGGVITLFPDRPLSELRGFVKGTNIEGFREMTDRPRRSSTDQDFAELPGATFLEKTR